MHKTEDVSVRGKLYLYLLLEISLFSSNQGVGLVTQGVPSHPWLLVSLIPPKVSFETHTSVQEVEITFAFT